MEEGRAWVQGYRSLSHAVTVDVVTAVGDGHDEKVIEWRDSLVSSVDSKVYR